jgi:hypothetical protein
MLPRKRKPPLPLPLLKCRLTHLKPNRKKISAYPLLPPFPAGEAEFAIPN